MGMHPVYGHETVLRRLEASLASGRFPQSVMLTGPAGVGKQRTALWISQGLLCDMGPGRPCGTCPACHKVLGLIHPDLHWFIPIPRPKASDAARQLSEAESTLAEVVAERRAESLYSRPDAMLGHPMTSIRLLLQKIATRPFEGRRKVFLIGNAERLVVQEASQEAANALLKALEEPPADATVLLTTSQPGSILATIRSRVMELRLPPVSDEAVRKFAGTELNPKPSETEIDSLTLLAEGSIGRLVAGEGAEADAARAERFLGQIVGGPSKWAAAALSQPPWSARGKFSGLLDALTVSIRNRLAEPGIDDRRSRQLLNSLQAVRRARESAQGNVNPQLTMAVLAKELETARWS